MLNLRIQILKMHKTSYQKISGTHNIKELKNYLYPTYIWLDW